jgi:hypothetical protein
MRHPWANIALVLLLIGQLITGFIGFTNGEVDRQWLLWLHGIGAYGITLLVLWKASIILNSFRRIKSWSLSRFLFIFLIFLLIATLLTGLIWTFSGPKYLFTFSLITIHIFIAVTLGGLLFYHIYRYRWIIRHPAALNRRSFLNLTAISMAGLVAWNISNRIKVRIGLPGAERRFSGSYETGSFSGTFPSVSWISDRAPQIDLANWRLIIDGAVSQPESYSYDQLLLMNHVDLVTVLDCTGGWFTEQVWRGIKLSDLIESALPSPISKSVTIRSTTGYSRRFELEKARDYILAYNVADQTLSPGHGYPFRLVAPGQRGVNWVKWVNTVTLNKSPAIMQVPLPLQ